MTGSTGQQDIQHQIEHDNVVPGADCMPSSLGLSNSKLGIWFFLVSEIMFFAGLIGAYVVLRFGTAGWPDPYNILAVRITAINTFLLICSSVTMVKAFQWSDHGQHKRAITYLIATILMGASFVGIQAFEYTHLIEKPTASLLHHVEDLMAEHGIAIPAEADRARRIERPKIISVSMNEDTEESSRTAAQDAVLLTAFTLLHEGRPAVEGSGESRLEAEMFAEEWDREVMNQAILPLLVVFPDDRTIRKLGLHHNLYPQGFAPDRDVFTSTFYIMTGFHGAHVSAGVIWLIVVLCLYVTGKRSTLSLELAGLYWHFVDLVWIILFTIVYLM